MLIPIKALSSLSIKNFLVLLLTVGVGLILQNKLNAQVYSFPEIKEIFFSERPQTGDSTMRADCFGSIDDMILHNYPPLHPEAKPFFKTMLKKAILEIKYEKITDGASVWQIFNHGFVIKTPTVTFGIDLFDYFNTEEFMELADLLDVYLVTHSHIDHYSIRLIIEMAKQGKPIVGPFEFNHATKKMGPGQDAYFSGLYIRAHDGLHSLPVRQYEIQTPEGLKILHTGDNQTSATLPLVSDVDILLLNSWINESGFISNIEGVRIAINKIKPKVTLPGHIMELGHLGGWYPPEPYRDPIASDDGSLISDFYILGWGERYHYNNSTNDSINPNIIENITYQNYKDSIMVFWDSPRVSEDGDTSTFYRVIVDDSTDFFTENHQAFFNDMINNIKIFSYDDCGNQSVGYAEADVTVSSNEDQFLINNIEGLFLKNFPNPFISSTTFKYELKNSGKVILKIFNLAGQEVATLFEGFQPIGEHEIEWDAREFPSGVYFYNLRTKEGIITNKCVLHK
jgi:L-ascorbate metabolism protein UlaG (beta-lactamase superfamily)